MNADTLSFAIHFRARLAAGANLLSTLPGSTTSALILTIVSAASSTGARVRCDRDNFFGIAELFAGHYVELSMQCFKLFTLVRSLTHPNAP